MKKPGLMTFIGGVGLFVLIEVLRLFNDTALSEFWRQNNADIIEPLEFASLYLIGIGIYLLFFNQTIQQAWWRWARWFIVWIAFLVLISGGGSGGFSIGGPDYMANLWFAILCVVTFIFTLYQRFYKKVGIQSS
jgi:hypothetical protein